MIVSSSSSCWHNMGGHAGTRTSVQTWRSIIAAHKNDFEVTSKTKAVAGCEILLDALFLQGKILIKIKKKLRISVSGQYLFICSSSFDVR